MTMFIGNGCSLGDGDVSDGVLFCAFFPTRCLGCDLRLNWVSFGGFFLPTLP